MDAAVPDLTQTQPYIPGLTPMQAYLPGFRRRVGRILIGLLILVDRGIARHFFDIRLWKHLYRLWKHLYRTARRFFDLMDRLAAPHPPRPRRVAHTDGCGNPGNLSCGSPFPLRRGWLVDELGLDAARHCVALQAVLSEPQAIELLAQAPAAARILRPICRMLGVGRFDPYRPWLRRLRHPPPDPTIPRHALIGVRDYTPPDKCEPWPGPRPMIWQLWYGFDDPPPEKPP